MTMEITTPQGQKSRSLELYSKESSTEYSLLVQITRPAFLSNMKYLINSLEGERVFRWLKTSRGVRSLSDAGGNEALFNSDFTVEDLSPLDPDQYNLSLVSSDTSEYYRIEATPKEGDLEYAHKEFFIHRETRLLEKIHYFDTRGDIIKKYILLETTEHQGGIFPLSAIMKNVCEGTETLLTIDVIEIPPSLPPRIFNKGSL